jgi:hypothetical protein
VSDLSDDELEKAVMDNIWLYIQRRMGLKKVPNESELLNAYQFTMLDDPTFASFLMAYVSLRSQERLTKRNNRLQFWLAILATASVVVAILSFLR